MNKFEWKNEFAHAVIDRVEFYMGNGDDKPYWYCYECGIKKSEQKPEQNAVCNAIRTRFCYEKFHAALIDAFPFYANENLKEQIKKEIHDHQWNFGYAFATLRKNLSSEFLEKLDDVEEEFIIECGRRQDYWKFDLDDILKDLLLRKRGDDCDDSFLHTKYNCPSTNFEYKQYHGQCVDVVRGEWLQLHNELNKS